MYDAVAFDYFVYQIFNVKVFRDSNDIISLLPTFSSIVGTTDYYIDKFVTAVDGANFGRALAQRNSIPVGVLILIKAVFF